MKLLPIKYRNVSCKIMVSALLLAAGLSLLSAQSAQSSGTPHAATGGASQPVPTSTPAQTAPVNPGAQSGQSAPVWRGSQVSRFSHRAEMYYEGVWGVGELRVKTAESGQLIRFDYRVVDPVKAAALNDKKAEPKLFDAQAGVSLVVPQMEKIGKLRQSSTAKAGMSYWMAFSNPTLAVKRGHRVDVVIGSFRANNLVVE
jgi:hypothetical protein